MKKNIFLIFYFFSINIFAQNQLDYCGETVMDVRIQFFDVYQGGSFDQKKELINIGGFSSWGFNILYRGLPLGPTVMSNKANASFFCIVDGQDYYQTVSLNKMLIGVATRLSIGTVSLGMIKEATFFEIKDLGFAGNKLIQRFGAFSGFNFLFRRENHFFNRTSCSFLLQYLEKKKHLDNFFFDFNLSSNIYEFSLGKLGFSPLVFLGVKNNEILPDKQYCYAYGLAFFFDKSKGNKSRNNFLNLAYRRTVYSSNQAFFDGLFVEINLDPYYLGIFRDDF